MTTVEVSSEELQEIAFNSGETLHMGGPFPVCHVKGTTYWARVDDVTIPVQRRPEDRGPLHTGPTVPLPAPRDPEADR